MRSFSILVPIVVSLLSPRINDSSARNPLCHILSCLVKIQVNTTKTLTLDKNGLVRIDVSFGTGIYISDNGHILTSAHTVGKTSQLQTAPISCVNIETGSSDGAIVKYIDWDSDIAILQNTRYSGRQRNENYMKLSSNISNADEGDLCFCIGIANEVQKYNGIYTISYGKIVEKSKDLAGYEEINWGKDLIVASCHVVAGFSGGLVFDSDYSLIGIVIGSYDANNYSHRVLIRSIKRIIETIPKEYIQN